MPQIDSAGTYVAEIVESSVDVTKKSNYPQFIGRFKAKKKYVEDAVSMAHFGLTEPSYVDWSSFNEDTIGYLVLFNSADEFNSKTAMFNYEQLQKATGWDGTEFESLTQLKGKEVLIRVEEEAYNDKVQLKVNWIDAADASPTRTLKAADADLVKSLSAKLKMGGITKKAPAPAKPVSAAAPSKPAVTKPAVTNPTPAASPAPTPAAGAAAAPVTPPVTAPTSPSEAKAPPKSKAPKAKAPPKMDEQESNLKGLPAAVSQGDAWDYVIEHKGENADSLIEETWLYACGEVANGRSEEQLTEEDWAKVRDVVIKDLAL